MDEDLPQGKSSFTNDSHQRLSTLCSYFAFIMNSSQYFASKENGATLREGSHYSTVSRESMDMDMS